MSASAGQRGAAGNAIGALGLTAAVIVTVTLVADDDTPPPQLPPLAPVISNDFLAL